MPTLTVTLICRNEAATIGGALDSVRWADEIVVIDSESTDETVEIARRCTPRVEVRPWPGYVEQKNHAADVASHDWILSLDADERVTPALADEIRATLASEPAARGYRIPRVSYYLGRWVRSTDWYPNYQLRLYDRRVARWTGRYVHESVAVDGPVGRLRSDLLHYSYRDLSHHLSKLDHYSTLAARQLYESGARAGLFGVGAHAAAAFLRNYILRGGFRDGGVGLIVSALNSYYVLLKLTKLWELRHPARSVSESPRGTRP